MIEGSTRTMRRESIRTDSAPARHRFLCFCAIRQRALSMRVWRAGIYAQQADVKTLDDGMNDETSSIGDARDTAFSQRRRQSKGSQLIRPRGNLMHKITSVSLVDARRVIDAGLAKASEIGSPSNIAVTDAGGNLLAFARMDDAWLGSIDIALNKAFTSRAFNVATAQLAGLAQPGQQFYGIQESNQGRVMIFAGGVPLKTGDEVVGSVGVSGGTGAQDQSIAEAAAAAL
jgi:uncharacterized protein GlcG (DUF336 family)